MNLALAACAGCAAAPGGRHADGCGHARCPGCGEQRLMCDDGCGFDDGRPALWYGTDPEDEVARAQNWWTTIMTRAGVSGEFRNYLVEDCDKVRFAAQFGQIRWDTGTQRYVTVRIDNTVLDHHMSGACGCCWTGRAR